MATNLHPSLLAFYAHINAHEASFVKLNLFGSHSILLNTCLLTFFKILGVMFWNSFLFKIHWNFLWLSGNQWEEGTQASPCVHVTCSVLWSQTERDGSFFFGPYMDVMIHMHYFSPRSPWPLRRTKCLTSMLHAKVVRVLVISFSPRC